MENPSTSSSCKESTSTEIVFFDIETNVPNRVGQRFWVLEFGAIVVCPQKLVELESYSSLIRPGDLSAVPSRSGRCDGITRDVVANAPSFEQVADSILKGRVWVDSDISRPAPTPVGMIDSLLVLTEKSRQYEDGIFGNLLQNWAAKTQEP